MIARRIATKWRHAVAMGVSLVFTHKCLAQKHKNMGLPNSEAV